MSKRTSPWTSQLFTLFFMIWSLMASAQNNENPMTKKDPDYPTEWQEINKLLGEGLWESAQEKLQALRRIAESDKKDIQVLKTIVKESVIIEALKEEGAFLAIDWLEGQEEKFSNNEKAILLSIIADKYSEYLNNNYWRLSDRTPIKGSSTGPLESWGRVELQKHIFDLYLRSIQEVASKDSPTEDYKAIIHFTNSETDQLRPSLFDLIANKAADYFINSRSFLTEPAYAFRMSDPKYFSPASDFSKLDIQSKDTYSMKYQALKIFQELLAYHIEKKNTAALIDLDIKRLEFAQLYSTLEDKEERFKTALDYLNQQYEGEKGAEIILLKLADWHYLRGKNYAPLKSQDYKWENKKAITYIQEILKSTPKGYVAEQAKGLEKAILAKKISLEVEEVLIPENAALFKINHKNVQQVHFKLVRFDWETEEKIKGNKRKDWLKSIVRLPSVRQWAVKLPNDQDYNSHAIESKMSGLEAGRYALIFSSHSNFSAKEDHLLENITLQVSNLALINRVGSDRLAEFMVTHRDNGAPLDAVDVTLYEQEYNRKEFRYVLRKAGTEKTNANGYFNISQRRKSFQIHLKKGADELWINRPFRSLREVDNRRTVMRTSFFLDRGIYRPGQLVYFKGIVNEINNADKAVRIVPNKNIRVSFRDANYQVIEERNFKTNEFGTFNGSFEIPKNGLTGYMSIRSEPGGAKSFQVEEYKRPKFKVDINPLAGDYIVNQEVEVDGQAMGFAGNAIDNAKFTYRVVRSDMAPFPWLRTSFYRPYLYGKKTEITNGEGITDEAGKFKIKFEALANPDLNPKDSPRFRYTVYVDVTDITGATQSNSQQVIIAYTGMVATVDFGQELDKAQNNIKLPVNTHNHNGQDLKAKGKIKIFQLESPDRILKKRYWDLPDQQAFTAEAFKKDFPNYPYTNENFIGKWSLGDLQSELDFNTEDSDHIELNLKDWPVGHYKLILESKDKAGNPIKFTKNFYLTDVKATAIPKNLGLWMHFNQDQYEPGDTLQLLLGSQYKHMNYLFEIEKEGKVLSSNWLEMEKWANLEKLVQEVDRGNITIHLTYIKNNRFYSFQPLVKVPYSNKELQIEYLSFRDKLKPGQEEEWTLKISGPKKEKVSAEVLATMYDQSLDQFVGNNWALPLYQSHYYPRSKWSGYLFDNLFQNVELPAYYYPHKQKDRRYPSILSSFNVEEQRFLMKSDNMVARSAAPTTYSAIADERSLDRNESAPPPPPPPPAEAELADGEASGGLTSESSEQGAVAPIQVRKNLDETVFFFPALHTDEDGNVLLKFKMKEALTSWKFMTLAHTKDMKLGISSKTVITQKELMVLPNAPRFVRAGDHFEFTAKVSNLTTEAKTGTAWIELLDANTLTPVDKALGLTKTDLSFTAEAGQSALLSWKIKIPEALLNGLTYRVLAQAGNFSDGEESSIPVLSNRMLVTETMPISVRGTKQKTFEFKAFEQSIKSPTAKAHSFKLEFTSNPAWLAVQSLPYLMEYPHECSEQVFNRYYANSLANTIVNQYPGIQSVFESWKNTDALKSKLSLNQELKAAMLEETPWVLDALSEEEQKAQIALLFDLDKMSEELSATIDKLEMRQSDTGGFPWFSGGRDSWYISAYITAGFGHLKQLEAAEIGTDDRVNKIVKDAIRFTDRQFEDLYTTLLERSKKEKVDLKGDFLWPLVVQHLYARSFYPEIPYPESAKEALVFFLGQMDKYWLSKDLQQQAQIALVASRMNKSALHTKIVKSLKERAIKSEELGMYWKYPSGYFWYQAPIETHALMIELFDEAGEVDAVSELKVWLLKNKQTNNWKTTKATAEAIYSLLATEGDDQLFANEELTSFQFTNLKKKDYSNKLKAAIASADPGTGYYSLSWKEEEIKEGFNKIKVKNPNKLVSWGAAYWQYFEDLDKIKSFKETPLQLKKRLYKSENSDSGPQLALVDEQMQLKPGDLLKVRIELKVDRDMEFVHLKDMRASGLEPVNVFSGYRWQDGFGYYESTKDVATHFFIDYLPKGSYVFEYPVRVNLKGSFSNGISSIQSMYAPEFTSHSEGIILKVGN